MDRTKTSCTVPTRAASPRTSTHSIYRNLSCSPNTELLQGDIGAQNTPSKNQTLTACSISSEAERHPPFGQQLGCCTRCLTGFVLVLPGNFAWLSLHSPNSHGPQRVLHRGQTHTKNIRSYYLSSPFTLLLLSGVRGAASELRQWSGRDRAPWGAITAVCYCSISHFTTVLLFTEANQDKTGFLNWKRAAHRPSASMV